MTWDPIRRSRLPAVTALLVLTLVACSTGVSPELKAQQCEAFANDVVGAHLAGTPNEQEVTEASDRMDSRVNLVGDPSAHDAALRLHNQLHSLKQALADKDAPRAAQVLERTQAAAREAAEACGLPEQRFLAP